MFFHNCPLDETVYTPSVTLTPLCFLLYWFNETAPPENIRFYLTVSSVLVEFGCLTVMRIKLHLFSAGPFDCSLLAFNPSCWTIICLRWWIRALCMRQLELECHSRNKVTHFFCALLLIPLPNEISRVPFHQLDSILPCSRLSASAAQFISFPVTLSVQFWNAYVLS